MSTPQLTFTELVAIGRGLELYAAALNALEGNTIDGDDLAASARSAAETLRGVRVASGMGLDVTIEVRAS